MPPANSRRPLATALMVFLLAAVVAANLIWYSEQKDFQEERTRIAAVATDHARALETNIERALSVAYALAALVRQGKGDIADFDAVAGEMLHFYPGVSSVNLAPAGIIRRVAPRADNQRAIGLDLLQDPLLSKEALIARDTGQLTLVGPMLLVQGGLGAVGRLPVFLENAKGKPYFWGFVNVVIRFPDALAGARLPELVEQGIDYELWRLQPDSGQKQIIAASLANRTLTEPVEQNLELAYGNWTLGVAPIKGWNDPLELWLKSVLGVLVSLLLGYVALLVAKLRTHQVELEQNVAERTQALAKSNEDLAGREALLRQILDTSSVAIFLVDKEGRITQANQRMAEMFGWPLEVLEGREYVVLVHPAERDTARQQMLALLNSEISAVDVDRLYWRADQTQFWGRLTGKRFHDANGVEQGLIGVISDIDLRKRNQERLELLLSEQKAVLENELVGIVRVISRKILWANPAFETMLGYAPGELAGMPTRATFPSEEAYLAFGAAAYPILAAGKLFRLQAEYLRKDGVHIWVDVNGAMLNRETGESLWCFIDVTVRKRLEQSIAQSEQRMELALSGADLGMWDLDISSGRFTHNPRLVAMAGYAPDEIEMIVDTFVAMLHPDDASKYGAAFYAHLKGETARLEAECRVRHKDGHWVWLLTRGQVVERDPNGRALRMTGTNLDITERHHAEEVLREAKEAAEAASVAKSRFLATVSHEIRTPLNGILGMAQLLLTPHLKPAERLDYTRTILNSGHTLLTLLNDILDFSKVEAGKIQLESTVFDPLQIIQEVKALFTENASRKLLRLDTGWTGPAGQRYLGDPYRLRQMLSNLVGNAIKFTDQGRVCIEGREIEREGQLALLELVVTDTGIGIAKEKHALLFQPFFQADSSTTRQYGGTGLGLSIVHSLASLMGGEVGIDSVVGQGSRFWFRIPAERVAPGSDSRQTERPRSAEPRPAEPKKLAGRVLVVEDNPTNRKVAEALLKKLGLAVAFAADGQQGLDAIMRGEPADLILMDLQMPVMDGYVATERIRRWEAEQGRPRRPIIALTANAVERDRQDCLAVGMDGMLTKPIVIDTMQEMLGRWLAPTPAITSAASAGKPLDTGRIAALWGELEPLLAENKFDAIGKFKELQEALAGAEFAGEVTAIGRMLAEFRFGAALERLRRMAAAHAWQGNPP